MHGELRVIDELLDGKTVKTILGSADKERIDKPFGPSE